MQNTLYVVDFSNWLYRYKNVFSIKHQKNGVEYDISTLFGFIKSLKGNPCKDIAICLDGEPQLSNELLGSYKGNRSKEPSEELSYSKYELVKFLSQFGPKLGKDISIYGVPGQEADQVVASITYMALKKEPPLATLISSMNAIPPENDKHLSAYLRGATTFPCQLKQEYENVVISSTDSDIYQLSSFENVFMDESTGCKTLNYDKHTPKAVNHVPPHCIATYKSIAGDQSDGVPELKLSIKPVQIAKIISENIASKEEGATFIHKTYQGMQHDNVALQRLATMIRETNQQNQLQINYRIVNLEFSAIPLKMVYPSYNIEDTIKEYRLRI